MVNPASNPLYHHLSTPAAADVAPLSGVPGAPLPLTLPPQIPSSPIVAACTRSSNKHKSMHHGLLSLGYFTTTGANFATTGGGKYFPSSTNNFQIQDSC